MMPDWEAMNAWEKARLVGTEVMGWTEVEQYRPVDGGQRYIGLKDDEGHVIAPVEFNPANRMSDAWRVVEVMREEDMLVPFALELERELAVVADEGLGIEHRLIAKVFELTTPEIICLAALRAKDVDV